MRRPLEGVRVVDFSWWRAGPWAGRILALLGAEVIKVEWPQMPLAYYRDRFTDRQMPDGVPAGLNNSPFFSENTTGKKSVIVNLRSQKGLEAVKKLISVSDVVLENFSAGLLKRRGLSYPEMKAIKEDIVYVSMAGLGHTGRYHEYKTFGPVVHALSGLTQMSGLPGKEPAVWRWAYMDDTGGMYGAMCVLSALYHRMTTGEGQHVDLSQVAAAMPLTGAAWLDFTVNGRSARREGFPSGNRTNWPGTPLDDSYRGPTVAPHNTYRTAASGDAIHNAWCAITCFTDEEWQRLVTVMGDPAWASDPRFQTMAGRLEHQDELDQKIEGWTLQYEKYALMRLCQSAGVMAMPVQDARDRVETDPQIAHRNLLQTLPHADVGPLPYQALPFSGSEMELSLRSAGPLAGAHNKAILCDLLGLSHEEVRQGYDDGTFWPKNLPLEPYLLEDLTPAGAMNRAATEASVVGAQFIAPAGGEVVPAAVRGGSGDLSATPFAGLRVLELADVRTRWTGKLMADLGADVVKIEPPTGSDEREVGPFYQDEPHPDRSLSFWHHNTSKRGITLDLESADGKALFERLAATADVVLEGFAPGYLPSLGLGYEALKRLNPRLIVCSVTDFGQSGPWSQYRASDLLHLAAGGEMAICGYDEEDEPDAPPIAMGGGQGWFMGAHYAFIGVAAALHQRHATGLGQYLDVSVHDACVLTTEGHINRYVSSGHVSERHRRGRTIAKSQFRCKDGVYLNSQWSSEMTPEHLAILAYWMDDYEMAGDLIEDERFQDQQFIKDSTSHIADLLEEFFASIDAEEAYRGAQERGFAFGPVRTMDDIVKDGHWEDRGFFVTVEHPDLGASFMYPGAPALYSATPWQLSRRAPTLGEHNAEILAELAAGQSGPAAGAP